MTALLLIGIVVVVLVAALRDYAPRPGEREGFRQAALRARHSLTDWGAAHAEPCAGGPVDRTGLRGRCRPVPVSRRLSDRRGNGASIQRVDI
ncbi:hypothetical protein [Nocardia wallacei]|uniref:hypothetical protein n=1 Tax=Nocardia wallacei TaxID=480035 RepID=UPI001656ACDB|nr:hypothetical protein [Nocardia wallacei]